MFVVPTRLAHLLFVGWLFSTSSLAVAEPRQLEVFTTADLPIESPSDRALQNIAITVYHLEGLAQLDSALSAALPGDPTLAKSEALRRMGALDDQALEAAKTAAIGLARAVQYGLDRYPAVVIDGSAIVYGVTDLAEAMRRYGAWQAAEPQ